VLRRRREQKPWAWLAAIAVITIIVVADEQIIQRQRGTELRVDRLYHVSPLGAARNVGLVGGADEEEAGRLERVQRVRDVRERAVHRALDLADHAAAIVGDEKARGVDEIQRESRQAVTLFPVCKGKTSLP